MGQSHPIYMCMPCRAACNYCAVMYEERIHMHASIHPSTIHVCALRCASCCCVVPLPYGLLFRLLVLADRDTPGSCFMHLLYVPAGPRRTGTGLARPAGASSSRTAERALCCAWAGVVWHARESFQRAIDKCSAVQCSAVHEASHAGKSASAHWASQPARDKVWGWVWAVHRLPRLSSPPPPASAPPLLRSVYKRAQRRVATPHATCPRAWACPNLIMHCPGTGATWTVIERSNWSRIPWNFHILPHLACL